MANTAKKKKAGRSRVETVDDINRAERRRLTRARDHYRKVRQLSRQLIVARATADREVRQLANAILERPQPDVAASDEELAGGN